MGFNKTGGIFKIASSKPIDNYNQWVDFKQANTSVKDSELTKEQTVNKNSDLEASEVNG